MRKLRQDITFKEAWEAWEMDSNALTITEYLSQLYSNMTARSHHRLHLPVSFYEQPLAESFGEFWRANQRSICGHLLEYNSKNVNPYLCENGIWYETFAPGLPTDVNADGMPK